MLGLSNTELLTLYDFAIDYETVWIVQSYVLNFCQLHNHQWDKKLVSKLEFDPFFLFNSPRKFFNITKLATWFDYKFFVLKKDQIRFNSITPSMKNIKRIIIPRVFHLYKSQNKT